MKNQCSRMLKRVPHIEATPDEKEAAIEWAMWYLTTIAQLQKAGLQYKLHTEAEWIEYDGKPMRDTTHVAISVGGSVYTDFGRPPPYSSDVLAVMRGIHPSQMHQVCECRT